MSSLFWWLTTNTTANKKSPVDKEKFIKWFIQKVEWKLSVDIIKIINKEYDIDELIEYPEFLWLISNVIKDLVQLSEKLLKTIKEVWWERKNWKYMEKQDEALLMSLLEFFYWLSWENSVKDIKVSITDKELRNLVDKIIENWPIIKEIIENWNNILKDFEKLFKRIEYKLDWKENIYENEFEKTQFSTQLSSLINNFSIYENISVEVVNESLSNIYWFSKAEKDIISKNWVIWNNWDFAIIMDWAAWPVFFYIDEKWWIKIDYLLSAQWNWPHV